METELTQNTYQNLMGANTSSFLSCRTTCPIDNINWHQAAEATNTLSDLESLQKCYRCVENQGTVTCSEQVSDYQYEGYRLPVEAEWEYTAKGHQNKPFYSEMDILE